MTNVTNALDFQKLNNTGFSDLNNDEKCLVDGGLGIVAGVLIICGVIFVAGVVTGYCNG